MSSETFVAYYGLRFEVAPEKIAGIELRSDSRIAAARKAGLKYYWGNFGGLQEKYLLLIGHEIGIFGAENSSEVALLLQDAEASFEVTKRKLMDLRFTEIPAIHLVWQPDI